MLHKTENTITQITRKAILDSMRSNNILYYGSDTEIRFLASLYDVNRVPSFDERFDTFEGDLFQHRENNYDWDEYWIFEDERFDLLGCSDSEYVNFLCRMIHPITRPDKREVIKIARILNDHLSDDNWELYESSYISKRPIFNGRKIGTPTVKIERMKFDLGYINIQTARMEKALKENDSDLVIGTAKELVETCLKTISGIDDAKHNIPELSKLVFDKLGLAPQSISDSKKGVKEIKTILNNLICIITNINSLRKQYGTGHGPAIKKTGLETRHAKLAMGSAITLVNFLFETWQRKSIKTSNQ